MNRNLKDVNKVRIILIFLFVIFLVLIFRLGDLQISNDKYKKYAESNAFYEKTIYPSRGLIYDRNGILDVTNKPSYDIMVTFKEVSNLDTLSFCRIIGIDTSFFKNRVKEIKNRSLNPSYSYYTPQVFMTQLSERDYGRLEEVIYRYRGFSMRQRMQRSYKYPVASHALGYVSEVSRSDINKDDYYVSGDYIGRSGIEREYEKYLRGEKGKSILLRDAYGRIKGRYHDGYYDKKAIPGKPIKMSIDIELQEYAEKLMKNKRGAIVAIEPSTGEILSYVSAPCYDPSLLTGKFKDINYSNLNSSKQKIFLNRPIQSYYPPGSTFKTVQGLTYLQEKIITPYTYYSCHNGYTYAPGHKLGCHSHPSPLRLQTAVAISCNGYFAHAYKDMIDSPKYKSSYDAMNKWRDYMVSFGLGYKLGVDLPYEKRGMIPNGDFYDKWYGHGRWKGSTVISNGIGQGEILMTPLQIANMCTVIANRGWFYTPHIVKEIDGKPNDLFTKKRKTMVEERYFIDIVKGMRQAVTSGTARGVSVPEIEVCGKTGTAQNSHGKDHSIFMCFAPMNKPKIAMVVFIENGGFGATWAVPMASLLIEKYLKRKIAEDRVWMEDRLLNANLIKNGQN